ncbi:MAG TPA: hypothetical protein VJH03_26615 [Blastocatellia bacterium]|nr:hypothetical protein [Blastocatellia bacterium]
MLRVALKLFAVVGLSLAVAFGASAQVKPSAEQMKELQQAMDEVQKALKDGDAAKIKDAKNKLIQLTDKHYKIPSGNLSEEPSYDPDVEGEGETVRAGDDKKKVKTTIGEPAFFDPTDGKTPSIGWLASTKIHEIGGHGAQAADGKWYTDDKGAAINEIEAYDLEIKNAETTGLSKGEIDELKKRRQEWYDQLNEANKKKIDKGDYTLVLLPPAENSKTALIGQPAIFVSGEVYADEVATTTVRGPRTLEGCVVTTEVAGQTAEAKTDQRGGALLSLPDSVARLTTATTAIVRVFDSTGKEIARTQTRVLPGPAPDVVSRPIINDIPTDLRRGDVVTIPGSSLGRQCDVVVGNQIQETLASSVNQVTAYVDTPKLGPQEAWVRNPYGESKSFETNVFSFEVSAPRTTIRRGEQLTATAQYQSLRRGSEIRFKNNTPGVVTMNVAGARTAGDEAVLTVRDPNGSIPVNLRGLSAGAFSISYEVVHPPRR